MKAVYVVMHQAKADAMDLLRQALAALREAGLYCYVEPSLIGMTSLAAALPPGKRPDAVISLGGDGTLLRANRFAVEHDTPVLGVNMGRIGFLTEVEPDRLAIAAQKLASGDFRIEKRMMLKAEYGDGQTELALNDVVISRGAYSRLIAVNAVIAGDQIGKYIADGVIVASPTGSTGYSLSAGGPIISPEVDCMLLSPICAHSLQHRPVVISDRQTIALCLDSDAGQQAQLSLDGQTIASLSDSDVVRISRASQRAQFIRFESGGFFNLVRYKLSEWSNGERECAP